MMDLNTSSVFLDEIFSQDGLSSRGLYDSLASGWEQFAAMVKSVDLRSILSLVVTFVAFVSSENSTQAVQNIGEGIKKEILAVKQPIDETIAAVGSSQCANVKKLFGVAYEQIEGEKEPDLTKLTLFYKTRSFTKIFNISEAAASLRQARALDSQGQQKVVIFVHGFTDDPTKNSFKNISESFLQSAAVGPVTLLALDGSSLIRWLYLRATSYVRFMGYELADVLVSIVQSGVDPSQIHMVGHSLGAHISGFSGKRFYELTGRRIGRISGMDPAGPCFSHVDDAYRLNRTDADYVDVIHSDAGVYGIRSPVGHADYYPNSGAMQPECFFQTCSHSRSWLLYAESVLMPQSFPALPCESWDAFKKGRCGNEISYMGYPSKPGTKGLYFLQTNGKYPFGKGIEGTKYVNTNGLIMNIQEEVNKNKGHRLLYSVYVTTGVFGCLVSFML